jgi:hypothetical protein
VKYKAILVGLYRVYCFDRGGNARRAAWQFLLGYSIARIYLRYTTNVLATQTRQPPTRDSARASYENQNQFNIKIDPKINPKVNLNLPYYINTL